MNLLPLVLLLATVLGFAQAQVTVNFQQFSDAVTNNGWGPPSWAQYNNFMQMASSVGSVANNQEAAMVLAHMLQETGGLKQLREEKCLRNNCDGEYRCNDADWCRPRNCDRPGQYYYGRGYLQLSWCANYQEASRAIFNDDRLLDDPDMVARDDGLAWRTAFLFWKNEVRNTPGVQQGQFGVSTRKINSMECTSNDGKKQKRFDFYVKNRQAFGVGGQADPTGC